MILYIGICMQLLFESRKINVFETRYLKYQENIERNSTSECENVNKFKLARSHIHKFFLMYYVVYILSPENICF